MNQNKFLKLTIADPAISPEGHPSYRPHNRPVLISVNHIVSLISHELDLWDHRLCSFNDKGSLPGSSPERGKVDATIITISTSSQDGGEKYYVQQSMGAIVQMIEAAS